jgi:hypothetical protein
MHKFYDYLQEKDRPSRTNVFVKKFLFPTPFAKIGVPQGAPISPLLAIMILDETMIKRNTNLNTKVVGYSDDWLMFSNDDEYLGEFDFPKHGIMLAEEKSF